MLQKQPRALQVYDVLVNIGSLKTFLLSRPRTNCLSDNGNLFICGWRVPGNSFNIYVALSYYKKKHRTERLKTSLEKRSKPSLLQGGIVKVCCKSAPVSICQLSPYRPYHAGRSFVKEVLCKFIPLLASIMN